MLYPHMLVNLLPMTETGRELFTPPIGGVYTPHSSRYTPQNQTPH